MKLKHLFELNADGMDHFDHVIQVGRAEGGPETHRFQATLDSYDGAPDSHEPMGQGGTPVEALQNLHDLVLDTHDHCSEESINAAFNAAKAHYAQ